MLRHGFRDASEKWMVLSRRLLAKGKAGAFPTKTNRPNSSDSSKNSDEKEKHTSDSNQPIADDPSSKGFNDSSDKPSEESSPIPPIAVDKESPAPE